MAIATWREKLQKVFEYTKDNFSNIVTTLSQDELDETFDDGWGGSEGAPFTAWSENYVYFPVVYDGSEWIGWVPRNPCDKKTAHVGGE